MKLAGKRFLSLLLAGVMLASLAACTSKPTENKPPDPTPTTETPKNDPVNGGKLVIGTIGDAESLNPIYSNDTSSSEVAYRIHESLIQADRKLEMEGELAEKWEFSNDGKTITFFLRKGVKWHDGQPFTARDVAFTYESIMHPLYAGTRQGDYDKLVGYKEAKAKYDAIKKDEKYLKDKAITPEGEAELIKVWEEFKAAGGIKVIDDYTIQFNVAETFAPFLTSFSMGIIPHHILKDVRPDKMKEHETNSKPVGTGPWKFVDWKKGDQLIVAANDDYWGGRPHIDQVIWKIIPDQNAIAVALEDGSIDLGAITPELFDRFNGREGFKLYEYQTLSYTFMGYNLRLPMFQDVRVRQAITHALDRASVVDAILMGHGTVANSHGAPIHWTYNPNVPVFDYNVEKAKQLLDEAGWKVGADGIREKDGKKFKFTLKTNQNKVREQVITIVQQQLKEVGIEVEPQVVEWSSFVSNNLLGQDFDAIVVGWSLGVDPDAFSIWHSSQTNKGQFNFVGWQNKDADALIEKGRVTVDQAQRKQIYGELQQKIAQDQPYSFLFFANTIIVTKDKFQGDIQGSPAGLIYNLPKWWIPTGKQ